MNTLAEKIKIINFNRDMPELDPGSNTIIDGKYFKRIKLDRQKSYKKLYYRHDVDIDKKYQKIINKVGRGFYLRILS